MSDSENGKGDSETTPNVKGEDSKDQKESVDSKEEEKTTTDDKKSKKSTKKEVKEENEDESDESEEEVGLLDRPVEVSGARERKKVERLEINFKTPSKDKHGIPEGRGEKLGDCPRIEFKVQKTPVDELKALHKVLFNRPGSAHEIKRNIRKFSGFSFSEGSVEFERKKSYIEKLKVKDVKHLCEVLDIERGGTKEEIAQRIFHFLLEPKSSGKPLPKSKKRSSVKAAKAKKTEKGSKKGSAKKAKKTSDSDEEASDESVDKEDDDEEEEEDGSVTKGKRTEKEKSNKKTTAKRRKKASDSDEEVSDESGKEDEEEDEDDAAEDSDSSDVGKKKKKGKPRKKKEVAPKKKEKNDEKAKKSEKKTPAKPAKRKNDSSDESDESSDGEPLAKKVKSPPSDDEIKQLVKKILDDADLEEITMKKVIKQVFDAYPDFDLSEKKDYIKATVKSVIS